MKSFLINLQQSAYFVKSTPRAFNVSFQVNTLQIQYATDILKMCMKKFNDKKVFFDKFTAFLT